MKFILLKRMKIVKLMEFMKRMKLLLHQKAAFSYRRQKQTNFVEALKDYYNLLIYNKTLIYNKKENVIQKIFKEEIDPAIGLQPFQARRIAFNINIPNDFSFVVLIGLGTFIFKNCGFGSTVFF